ncbi:MAG: GNAT family N-acetyltransferase [Eisenbergiella massiliensis]
MNRRLESCEEFCEECVRNKDRCFAAFQKGEPCAYLKLSDTGETFITQASDYIHITGAFCLPEYRGRGLYQNLLDYAVDILEKRRIYAPWRRF